MQEETVQSVDSSSSKIKSLKSKKHIVKVVCASLAAITLVASILGIYYWQHQKVLDLESKISGVDGKLAKADAALEQSSKKYGELEEQYKALQAEVKLTSASAAVEKEETPPPAPPTQADLDLTVVQATTFRSGTSKIGIIITLKNSTDSNVAIKRDASYKLKDSANHSFTNYGSSEWALGKNYAGLTDQTLAPGETVTGAIEFTIADDSVTDYTLYIGAHSCAVKAKQL